MKRTKFLAPVAAVALIATGLMGCTGSPGTDAGGDQSKADDATDSKSFNPDEADGQTYAEVVEALGDTPVLEGDIKLGGVAKSFENEYWRTLKEGMEEGASQLSAMGMNVSIEVASAQGENDEQGQLSIVDNFINQKVDALLLSPISDGNLVPAVEKANAEGIPAINVNDGLIAEAPWFVGPKAIENGELAAAFVAEKIGGEGDVAIVIGMPKAFAARQRTAGFENYMAENAPGIKIVEKQNADWDRAKAKDLADTWIKTQPDLKAIFCNNDTMALGVVEAVKASGKDIIVVGVDGTTEAYESIRAGALDATVDSYPYYKGQIAVDMAARVLGGQEVPRVVWTPQALIDASNVDVPAEETIGWQGLK